MNNVRNKRSFRSWLKQKFLTQHVPKTQNELIDLLRESQLNGLIDVATLAMLEGVFMFSNMKVRDVMLPKKQMTCINENTLLSDIVQLVTHSGHSRFPVTSTNKDEVIGILHAKDLLAATHATDEEFQLFDCVRQATFIPESKRLDLLLNDFRLNRNHMAIVVDEYGVVSGFVTLEDLVEQIIGDIADEFDIDEEAYIKSHGDRCTIIKAHTPIEEFNAVLDANFKDNNYDTIGGIVMAGFGYLPRRGEVIHLAGFSFKIIHADARRIKLLECMDERH